MDNVLIEPSIWLTAGWTMLHFLWMGTLIAVIAAAGRKLIKNSSPLLRYNYALVCLIILTLVPMVLFASIIQTPLMQPPTAEMSSEPIVPDAEFQPEIVSSEPLGSPSSTHSPARIPKNTNQDVTLIIDSQPASLFRSQIWDQIAAWMPWVWLFGTPITFAVVALGLAGSWRLKSDSNSIDDRWILNLSQQLAASLNISRKVTIRVCERIVSPILVGIVRPVILLPPALLTGCSTEQMEMILLHELAHVRRWDNLVNLLQRIIESFLFFHPVVWMVSGRVRQEREECCDQIVVNHTDHPMMYAEILAALASSKNVLLGKVALAAM